MATAGHSGLGDSLTQTLSLRPSAQSEGLEKDSTLADCRLFQLPRAERERSRGDATPGGQAVAQAALARTLGRAGWSPWESE